MKKSFLLLLLTVIVSFSLSAQQKEPVITFKTLKHDFGNITQEKGPVKVSFDFTNTGGKPIIISDIKASCGCTTPEWSRQPIVPGATGNVVVSYDPRNRPGYFSKSITVKSNASNNTVVLSITGSVSEKQDSKTEEYPHTLGKLRVDKFILNYGNTFNTETNKSMVIKMYNPTQEVIKVGIDSKYSPKYATVKLSTTELQPKSTGTITVNYNATKVNDWGFVRGFIYLMQNGQRISNPRIQLSATIKEKYTDTQLKNPPQIVFKEQEYNFGTANQGDVITHEFEFTNTGKSDLIIRKTRTSCGCTAVSLSKDPVKPGKKGKIKVVFNTNGKSGQQTKTVTITTNCPDNKYNTVFVKLKGTVKTK